MIYQFNTNEIPQLSNVGGKAKSLIETTNAGFNVPEGFVLSVDFFNAWTQEIKDTSAWKDFLANPSRENCDVLKKLTDILKFTAEQKEALGKALKGLSEQSIFAVRSSSPEEDLEGTSFAGMYDTMLGVTYKKLEKSIIHTFASMLDTRVVEYKKLNNISINNPKIAIIVQRQIPSEISGIAFSINPNNNCFDEVMINASFGLGETIVSGQVTPDTYIVDKVKNKITEKNIGEKIQVLWLQKDGVTVETKNENPMARALTDEQIMMVSDLVSKCERHYGVPIDTEWAIYEGNLYLLQARPVTTYNPLFEEMLTKPGEKKILYFDITIISQGFSEPFSTLGLDIWTKIGDKADMGVMPEGEGGMIFNVHGKQYMNISNMLLGFGEAGFMEMIGPLQNPEFFKTIDLKEYTTEVKTKKMEESLQAMQKLYADADSKQEVTFSDPEKLAKAYRGIEDEVILYIKENLTADQNFDILVNEGIEQYEKLAKESTFLPPVMAAFGEINEMFKDKGVEDLIVALGMDLPHNPTSEMGYMMVELATYDEIQNTKSAKEFIENIEQKKYSDEIMNTFDNYMDKYGARGFKEIDIAAPRTYEKLEDFFNQLKHIRVGDNAMTTVKLRKERAYKKLLELAKQEDVEEKFVKSAKVYNSLMGCREHPKYLLVILVGKLREIALKIGSQFKDQGRLQSVDQIFYMSVDQVAEAQKNPELDLLAIIEKELKVRQRVAHIKDWPKIVNSRGKTFRYIRKGEKGDLVGDPIAPGVVKGKAKVLNTPYEKELEKGEILVARATEPAWTPVFVNAAGVVLEVGGPMQHGAIIAREYGIPCVSGINDATTVIKDGDLLEVDGSSGIVKIIK